MAYSGIDSRFVTVVWLRLALVALLTLGCSDTDPTFGGTPSGGGAGMGSAGLGGGGGKGGAGGAGTGGADQCGTDAGNGGQGTCSAARSGPRVVGYLPTYRGPFSGWAERLDFNRLTHLMLAFAQPSSDGDLSLPEQSSADLSALVAAAHACNVKVSISLGGGADSTGSEILKLIRPENVADFAGKIVDFVTSNQLDGVDVDLEGDSVNADYAGFVAALETVLKPQGKLLTAALGTWFADAIPAAALDKMDFISAMAYDQYGAWTEAGHHSPYELAVSQANFWTNERGVPAEKVVLGVPFYGYYWGSPENTALTYADILRQYPGACGQDWIQGSGFKLSYNGVATIRRKAELSKAYGGTMVWELGQDATGGASLLRVVADTLAQ